MIKKFTSPTQQRGKVGEDIAKKYLQDKGFRVVAENYATQYGEIDIVALKDILKDTPSPIKDIVKDTVLYMIEVKTSFTSYLPDWNVSREKINRLADAADEYLEENDVSHETRFGVVLVNVSRETPKASVRFLDNLLPDDFSE